MCHRPIRFYDTLVTTVGGGMFPHLEVELDSQQGRKRGRIISKIGEIKLQILISLNKLQST